MDSGGNIQAEATDNVRASGRHNDGDPNEKDPVSEWSRRLPERSLGQDERNTKDEYRGLDDLVQNIQGFTTVAGSSRAELLQFIILMARFGDKGPKHPVKLLDFVDDNGHDMYDFPKEMNHKLADVGKRTTARVIRLHCYQQNVADMAEDDWSEDSLEYQHMAYNCEGIDECFMLWHSLAFLGASASSYQELLEKDREGSLDLHQAVYQHYEEHRNEFLDLKMVMDNPDNCVAYHQGERGTKAKIRTEIRRLVFQLYAKFWDEFSGFIVTTTLPGNSPNFARSFNADICIVDNHTTTKDLISIIRHHKPSLLLTIGDPHGIAPHARYILSLRALTPCWSRKRAARAVHLMTNTAGWPPTASSSPSRKA
ncbi:hypothetical protein N657DRAFT_629551 [Parathielavia appendiculata]|uniref:Uncharacterized protein n=1 Tax=Parathielavia appendiculata TaxID=2587402 RepID=A0AAN6U963_9PEZI|nr:hypothetical protein N657DRAFT_629551 [Parathielavia appendiculata]